MGSSGTGKFGTYRIYNDLTTNGTGAGSWGTDIGSGGETSEVVCPPILENIRLEDVATSAYFLNHRTVPKQGESVFINSNIYKGRLVVSLSTSREVLGNLPTQYNYIINCMKKGIQYTGAIVAAGLIPVPFVVVTLHA